MATETLATLTTADRQLVLTTSSGGMKVVDLMQDYVFTSHHKLYSLGSYNYIQG